MKCLVSIKCLECPTRLVGFSGYREGKHEEALVRFETLLGLQPLPRERAVASYNLACCYSKLGNVRPTPHPSLPFFSAERNVRVCTIPCLCSMYALCCSRIFAKMSEGKFIMHSCHMGEEPKIRNVTYGSALNG